jgi:hypothetical protein
MTRDDREQEGCAPACLQPPFFTTIVRYQCAPTTVVLYKQYRASSIVPPTHSHTTDRGGRNFYYRHRIGSTTEVHSQLGSSMHETAVDGVTSSRSFFTLSCHSPNDCLALTTCFPDTLHSLSLPRASLELHTRFPRTCHSLTYYVPRARLVLTTRWPDTCHSMVWFLLLAGVELFRGFHLLAAPHCGCASLLTAPYPLAAPHLLTASYLLAAPHCWLPI